MRVIRAHDKTTVTGLVVGRRPRAMSSGDGRGLELRSDFTYGGGIRWVEVAPAGAANTIALVGPGEGRPAGDDRTLCAFVTTDIEADHASLRARGVDVDEIAGAGASRAGLLSTDATVPDPVPAQFLFRDPDGNRFLIVQPVDPTAAIASRPA